MIYTYEHPETGERIEVEQKITDIHEFTCKDGIQWYRIFDIPNVSMNNKVDPWSVNQFMDKTNGSNQKLSDLYDRSQELSEMRAEQSGGADPLRVKAEADYSKKRMGRKLPKKFKDLDVKLDTTKIKK